MTLGDSMEQPHGSMTYPKGEIGDLKERLGILNIQGFGLIFSSHGPLILPEQPFVVIGELCSVLPRWRKEREGHGLHSFLYASRNARLHTGNFGSGFFVSAHFMADLLTSVSQIPIQPQ